MHLERKLAITTLLTVTLIAGCTGNTARTCYTCNGINCQRTSMDTMQKCLDTLDYCVTIFENFKVVQKGCSSEIAIERRSRCMSNSAECHKCYTDRCNDLGQANFMCLQCDSSKNADCANNAAAIAATRCVAPTAPNSYCYVKYEGSTTKRGCATAVSEQQTCYADGNCMLCLPGDISDCNNIDFTPGSRIRQF